MITVEDEIEEKHGANKFNDGGKMHSWENYYFLDQIGCLGQSENQDRKMVDRIRMPGHCVIFFAVDWLGGGCQPAACFQPAAILACGDYAASLRKALRPVWGSMLLRSSGRNSGQESDGQRVDCESKQQS